MTPGVALRGASMRVSSFHHGTSSAPFASLLLVIDDVPFVICLKAKAFPDEGLRTVLLHSLSWIWSGGSSAALRGRA